MQQEQRVGEGLPISTNPQPGDGVAEEQWTHEVQRVASQLPAGLAVCTLSRLSSDTVLLSRVERTVEGEIRSGAVTLWVRENGSKCSGSKFRSQGTAGAAETASTAAGGRGSKAARGGAGARRRAPPKLSFDSQDVGEGCGSGGEQFARHGWEGPAQLQCEQSRRTLAVEDNACVQSDDADGNGCGASAGFRLQSACCGGRRERDSVEALLRRMEKVVVENKLSIAAPGDTSEERKQWWQTRKDLDGALQALLHDMEDDVLGIWRGLLAGRFRHDALAAFVATKASQLQLKVTGQQATHQRMYFEALITDVVLQCEKGQPHAPHMWARAVAAADLNCQEVCVCDCECECVCVSECV